MMKRTLTTDFVDNTKQNSNNPNNNKFGFSNDHIGSSLDNIDTNSYLSSFISRTDSNNNNSNTFDVQDSFYNNRNFNTSNSSLAVPLTPIGCNKATLNINNNNSNIISNVNNAGGNNLFGKYLMNKKLNSLKQQSVSSNNRIGSSLANESERATQIASSSGSSLIGNDVGSFDNDDDREFFQSITNATTTSNNNNNYYYNSNSAISRGSFLDNELLAADNTNYQFNSNNNDVEDLMLDDTLDQIYNNNNNVNNNNNNGDEELNYTINPMITQINPKQFASADYDFQDIDMLLQEAEEIEQAATVATNNNNLNNRNSGSTKSVSDYNIFIKGDDGVELPVQEVFKKFNFNLYDSNFNNNINTPLKPHIHPSLSSPSSLSPPSTAVGVNPINWHNKLSSFTENGSNSFANVTDVIDDSIAVADTTQKLENDISAAAAIKPMVNTVLKEEKATKHSSSTEEYKCEHANCKKSFSRPYDLVRHTKTIHSKQKKLYRCLICIKELGDVEGHKKTFSRGDALSRHIKLKHELNIGDESLRFAMKFAKENVEYVEN